MSNRYRIVVSGLILFFLVLVILIPKTYRENARTQNEDQPTTSPARDGTARAQTTRRTGPEIDAAAKPCDFAVITHLDLTRPPTEAELIAAGNLGEPLTPTASADFSELDGPLRARLEADNLFFGTAIQAWNEHDYDLAYRLFEEHIEKNPDSPWAAESKLHLGCHNQYHGRLIEASARFDDIVATEPEQSRMWYKAKLRRSILHTVQGNFDQSSKGFRELIVDNPDHRHITYASYWLKQINLIKRNETAFRDCGQKAIARVAEIMGQPAAADGIRALTAAGPHGYTATELENTALLHGFECTPVSALTALDSLPVPFIAHYNSKHYVTVEGVAADQIRLFDSRVGNTTTIPRRAFELEWSGFSPAFSRCPESGGHP